VTISVEGIRIGGTVLAWGEVLDADIINNLGVRYLAIVIDKHTAARLPLTSRLGLVRRDHARLVDISQAQLGFAPDEALRRMEAAGLGRADLDLVGWFGSARIRSPRRKPRR
jgi:hypothetical protein